MIARWRGCLFPSHVSKVLRIYSEFCVEALRKQWKRKMELSGELIVMLNGHITLLYMVSKLILSNSPSKQLFPQEIGSRMIKLSLCRPHGTPASNVGNWTEFCVLYIYIECSKIQPVYNTKKCKKAQFTA